MIGDMPSELIDEYSDPYKVKKVRDTNQSGKIEKDARGYPVEQPYVETTANLHVQSPKDIDLENVQSERNFTVKVGYSTEKLEYKDEVLYNEKWLSVENIRTFTGGTNEVYRYILVSVSIKSNAG